MNENIVNIATKDGQMETFTVSPDGDGPFPVVVLYMDAPGIREELYDFCRRIAGEGYYAVLPDMYYRLGRMRYDLQGITPELRKEMMDAMGSINNALVMDDTAGILEFLKSESRAKPGAKGCIGYCMSGQYVVSAAGTYPEDFAAAASLYGVGIVTGAPDSPHLLAPKIKGEVYFGFASDDPYVPDNVIPDLKAALETHNVSHKLDIWPDTEHGFCFPQRPAYAKEQAEKVWDLVFDLYRRRLG